MNHVDEDAPFDPDRDTHKTILERWWLGAGKTFAAEQLPFLLQHPDAFRDELGRLVVQLSAYVWSQVVEERHVQYPADWWQAVKDRWFPERWKRRWPVRYTTVILEARAIYPDLKYVAPSFQPIVVITKEPAHD